MDNNLTTNMSCIHSEYLGIDFEVRTYQAKDCDAQVIMHEALEDIIMNNLSQANRPDLGLKYKWTPHYSTNNHFVVECEISDTNGRIIKAIGESSPESLETKIAKIYPGLMAFQRSFDRAVIRYLQFPGKTFSSSEGVPYDDGVCTVNANNIPSPPPQQPRQNIQQPQQNYQQTAPQNKPVNDYTSQQTEVPNTQHSVQSTAQPQAVSDDDILISIGRYQNKPTPLSQVWKDSPDWVEWIVNNYQSIQPECMHQKEACVRYYAKKTGARTDG